MIHMSKASLVKQMMECDVDLCVDWSGLRRPLVKKCRF